MKIALAALVVLLTVGCAHPPTAPDAFASTSVTFWGLVLSDETGFCIVGATAKVVAGQALGQAAVQTTTCSPWDYGDTGFTFKGLTPNVQMTIRVSASGYESKDVVISPSGVQRTAFEIALVKSQQ